MSSLNLFLAGVPYPDFLADLRALLRHEITLLFTATAAPSTSAAADDELLTIDQAAQLLDVCRQTIHEWKRRGLLPYHKMGKRTYFKKSDLLGSLHRHERTRKGPVTSNRSTR